MIASKLVHLELHTPDQVQASAFYARLLHWRPELIRTASRSYLSLELSTDVGGGIVECGTQRPVWLPYVEVGAIDAATEHARRLGSTVVLEPREGPSGWRSIVATQHGGEVALWERRR